MTEKRSDFDTFFSEHDITDWFEINPYTFQCFVGEYAGHVVRFDLNYNMLAYYHNKEEFWKDVRLRERNLRKSLMNARKVTRKRQKDRRKFEMYKEITGLHYNLLNIIGKYLSSK